MGAKKQAADSSPRKPHEETVSDFLSREELSRLNRQDPTQRIRKRPLAGQKLFGKDRVRPDTNDLDEDEPWPSDHPQRDS